MNPTPQQEKAKELIDKFMIHSKVGIDCKSYKEAATAKTEHAKQCALLCVDEIINTLNLDIRDLDVRGNILLNLIQYWRTVREAIINL